MVKMQRENLVIVVEESKVAEKKALGYQEVETPKAGAKKKDPAKDC